MAKQPSGFIGAGIAQVTSKIPPAQPMAERAVISFPTPVISSNIITEYVSTEKGSYRPIPYGTAWDDLTHGPFQEARPDFELVYQTPADVNGLWIKRIWANPRADQSSYNYSIDYSEGNPAYPNITRLEVVKRSEYAPADPLTPDPMFPGALLVQEKMLNQTEPPEINSEYVTVAKVYETLPGPVVFSADFDSTLDSMVTTRRQVVLSSDTFDPDTIPLLLQGQESPQSEYKKLRALSYLLELPADIEEESTGTYAFPTLVTDIPIALYQLTTDPQRSEVYWYFVKQDAPQVPALLKTTTSFSIDEPAGETLFVLPVQTLFYRGVSFQITIANVLNNAITCSVAFTADARYGDLSESHTFAASAITAAQYASTYQNTYQIIGCDIKRYRGRIFTKRVVTCLML